MDPPRPTKPLPTPSPPLPFNIKGVGRGWGGVWDWMGALGNPKNCPKTHFYPEASVKLHKPGGGKKALTRDPKKSAKKRKKAQKSAKKSEKKALLGKKIRAGSSMPTITQMSKWSNLHTNCVKSGWICSRSSKNTTNSLLVSSVQSEKEKSATFLKK